MKGMPTNDGFFLKREPGHPNMCVELWTKGKTYRFMEGYLITGREREFVDAEFFPIPPPPDDGEYACVWVQVQRDAEGKRTCNGCDILGDSHRARPHCSFTGREKGDWKDDEFSFGANSANAYNDCPLGSD